MRFDQKASNNNSNAMQFFEMEKIGCDVRHPPSISAQLPLFNILKIAVVVVDVAMCIL